MPKYQYTAIIPKQSDKYTVASFCAPASDILEFARIDRIGRGKNGSLKGFQRPQVANHITEIRSYLASDDAVLPNSVVVAFTSGVKVTEPRNGCAKITINNTNSELGFIVDGQQRLTALSGLEDKQFEVLVSAIICESEEELRKQFILINNTKPLPKQLIYELLPTVDGLPHRLSSRTTAAKIIEMLNYREDSSLHGQIKQHTNPSGVLQDTVLQKLIMNSLSDGVLRHLSREKNGLEECFRIISEFFLAVQTVFVDSWNGHKPKTSRLVHGVGVTSMGFVMEYLHSTVGATTSSEFKTHLAKLESYCAWTGGTWVFAHDNQRPWNGLQYVPRDYMELTHFLLSVLKKTKINQKRNSEIAV